MDQVAYLFPGQGSQKVGMGYDLYERFQVARDVFQQADDLLGYPLSKLCFEGPEDKLRQTIYTQPAVFTVSYACLAVARELDVLPSSGSAFVAGHSLGEYNAAVAAGSLTFEQALPLVHQRATLMEQAGQQSPGTMAAVMGMEFADLEAVCKQAGAQIANINSPEQVVISGPVDAIKEAISLAEAGGAKRVVPLEVGGAFHSRLMLPAQEGMAAALATVSFADATTPIIANATAQPLTAAETLREELRVQLCAPVRWTESVEYMIAGGVTQFIEIGPGRVLSGLVKRINRDAATTTLGDLAAFNAAKAA